MSSGGGLRRYVVFPLDETSDFCAALLGPQEITGKLVYAPHPRKAALQVAGHGERVLVFQLAHAELHGRSYQIDNGRTIPLYWSTGEPREWPRKRGKG